MSSNELKEVRKLAQFAPIDREYQELEYLYREIFRSLSGLEDFVISCNGVRGAVEVLKICDVRR